MDDTMISPEFAPEMRMQPEPITGVGEFERHQNAVERALFLDMLPSEGFEEGQKGIIVEQIVAVGLPVDNIRSLHRCENTKGRENVLGSWGVGSDNFGEYSVYELLDRQIPEHRLSTIAHESAHANTPFQVENSRLFGGETVRQETSEFVKKLSNQSLETGRYINGYQQRLADQLRRGEISKATFEEETWAITSELALTNRAKLAQIQDSQHHRLDYLISIGQAKADQKVNIISTDTGVNPELEGIDKALVALVDGVINLAELKQHVAGLKTRFYPDRSLAIAYTRGTVDWNSLQAAQQDYIYKYYSELLQRDLERQRQAIKAEEDEDNEVGGADWNHRKAKQKDSDSKHNEKNKKRSTAATRKLGRSAVSQLF